MPSSVQAQRVQEKALSSGLYSFYWGISDTVLDDGAKVAAPDVVKMADCLNGCNKQALCAGIAYHGYHTAIDAVTSCTYIMGTVEPGNSLRSLTRNKYTRLQSGLSE